ncbi:uncharacterized protein CBL_06767 [Carabus blaptoides fortunei]
MVNKIENLVVDTTAFINNAPLQEIASNIVTVQEVVDEITNKRQLRRLVVLPYDLAIKDVFPENVKAVTEFSKKTGDYPSLSATDIKVMALTYQLEKEKVGTVHLRQEPVMAPTLQLTTHKPKEDKSSMNISGFYLPGKEETKEAVEKLQTDSSSDHNEVCDKTSSNAEESVDNNREDTSAVDEEIKETVSLSEKFASLDCGPLEDTIEGQQVDDILASVNEEDPGEDEDFEEVSDTESGYSDDETGWITPTNVQKAKKQMNDEFVEDKSAVVACLTTDFAMQNVLKQLGLNVAALDGRMIRQIRTFILRCHTCFKTTSLMDKVFCPKCGNKTLKKVAVSVDADGKQHIHINTRRPLTGRGKKFSLPTFKGGKHSSNPVLSADQPMPQQRASRQAILKNNPLDPDYIAGYSPFVIRDVYSRSALLGIRPGTEVKHWMKKNPNQARRKRK